MNPIQMTATHESKKTYTATVKKRVSSSVSGNAITPIGPVATFPVTNQSGK